MIEFRSEKRLDLEYVRMYLCYLLKKKGVITVEDFINGCNKRICFNIDSYNMPVVIKNENNDCCYIYPDGIYGEPIIFKNISYGWNRKDIANIVMNNDSIEYNEPIKINVENIDENTKEDRSC